MPTGVLLPIDLHGQGTNCVESFLSILNRTADAYQVSTARVLKLLAGMFDHHVDVRSIDTHVRLLGYSEFTERAVSTYYILTGRECHPFLNVTGTLLPLRGVLAWNGTGIFAKRSAWCPVCLDPERGVEYKMLAHELMHVRHCPLHGAILLTNCMKCGKPRHSLFSGVQKRHCAYCREPLWDQAAQAVPVTAYDTWAEIQALKLIEYVATPDRLPLPSDWYTKFLDGMKHIRRFGTGYSLKERKYLRLAAERTPYGSRTALPRWETLLRVASIQSIDAVDLILDPVSALSPKLFNDENLKFNVVPKKYAPRKRLIEFVARLERLLKEDGSVILPSLLWLARDSKVDVQAVKNRAPNVVARYRAEVRCRQEYRKTVAFNKAFEVASRIVRNKEVINIREDGAIVRKEAGVSKAVAESSIHSAIAWRSARAG